MYINKKHSKAQFRKQGNTESMHTFCYEDNRPTTVIQRKLRNFTSNRSGLLQLKKKTKRRRRSKMGTHAREARREARYASTTGGGTTIFNNNEGRLPRAGRGQHYIETDVGRGRHDRGRRRIVSLVQTSGGRVLRQYITEDHYRTFSEIR